MKVRKYNYRRNLPHIELSCREHFITFDTYLRWELPPAARDIALRHCLHDNGSKMRLHVAVVMPDHVHMIFEPVEDANGETFSFQEIVGAIKGASSHSINKALKRS
ncbi:MAG TPA: transposase, partial [Candidatus Angelobacter sp.]|nr:transposase [Candidatus Angelobacter sp.]